MTAPLPTYEQAMVDALKNLAIDVGIVTNTATAGTNALTDSTKFWPAGIHRNRIVKIIAGVGAGQAAYISGNSVNTLGIRSTWLSAVGIGAVYVILNADFEQMMRDVFFGGGGVASFAPISRVNLFNVVGCLTPANVLAVALSPLSPPCTFRVEATFSAGGILSATITQGGVTVVSQFHGGVALNINSGYRFYLVVNEGDTINYRYSANSNILSFKVQEVPVAVD